MFEQRVDNTLNCLVPLQNQLSLAKQKQEDRTIAPRRHALQRQGSLGSGDNSGPREATAPS